VPTVLRVGGFAVRIYLPPREHEPPHVHVVGAGGEIVVTLGDANTPPALREAYRMRRRDVLSAYRVVEEYQLALLTAWEMYHGTKDPD
jgi:Domain of unknown function (DUF4160)